MPFPQSMAAPGEMDLQGLEDRALLALYARTMAELQRRGVIRSTNNPIADLAEKLVTEARRYVFSETVN